MYNQAAARSTGNPQYLPHCDSRGSNSRSSGGVNISSVVVISVGEHGSVACSRAHQPPTVAHISHLGADSERGYRLVVERPFNTDR